MKILLISDLYPIVNSNEPVTLLNFVNNWKRLGYEVDVIRPNFLLNAFIRKKKILDTGVYTDANRESTIYNINYMTPFWFDVEEKIPEELDLDSYSAVISHMPSGALFAQKILEESTIPYICSVHASDIEVLSNPIYKIYFSWKLRKAYKKADLVAARSPYLKKKINSKIKETKSKTFIAYSGIDSKQIEDEKFFNDKAKRFSQIESDTIHFVSVASLIKRKNINIILKTLSELYFTNWKLSIIGTGKQINYLSDLAIKLGISDKVEFLGSMPNEDVLNFLKTTDIFILPSVHETFGMAYLEAMAKANIVIATQNDGIDGIIKDKVNGFTSKPKVKDLVEKIYALRSLSPAELKDMYHNIHNTISEYTAEKAAINYICNIKKVIKN